MTHRQFEAWQEWLAMQWNLPDRSDHYMMQVAAMQSSEQRTIDDFRIKFTSSNEPVVELPEVLDEYGHSWFPRRMTKESIAKAEQDNFRARLSQMPVKPNHQAAASQQIDQVIKHNEKQLSKRNVT